MLVKDKVVQSAAKAVSSTVRTIGTTAVGAYLAKLSILLASSARTSVGKADRNDGR